jgi:hypothetical protein
MGRNAVETLSRGVAAALVDIVPVDAVKVVVVDNSPGVEEVATQVEELDEEQREVLDVDKCIGMDAGPMLALDTVEGDVEDTADTVGRHL